jgi:hypothetical protein
MRFAWRVLDGPEILGRHVRRAKRHSGRSAALRRALPHALQQPQAFIAHPQCYWLHNLTLRFPACPRAELLARLHYAHVRALGINNLTGAILVSMAPKFLLVARSGLRSLTADAARLLQASRCEY